MDTFPIEFIPSCLQKIVEKCSPNMLPHDSDLSRLRDHTSDHDFSSADLEDVGVNIDMYVLTWPMPSQCPYMEASSTDSSAHVTEPISSRDSGSRAPGARTGLHAMVQVPAALGDKSGDEEEELMGRTKVEMIRQLPDEVC